MDRRLMLVHAHPDDETIYTGATMARYVSEGASVTLVTCTAGEMGEILVPDLAHLSHDREDRLGEARRDELTAAMKHLGVTDHRWLGGFGKFRDSGMKWHPDGYAMPDDDIRKDAFWLADLKEAADPLVEVIREVRPQVLVTYDENGHYGHPDHVQAHRVSMYATTLAAAPSYRRDLGEAWDVPKIYWAVVPLDPSHVTPDRVTTRIDAMAFNDAKQAALREYPTQLDAEKFGARLTGREFFRLARGKLGERDADGYEPDLFA